MNPSSGKMDSQLTGMWVNFFTSAGIPSDVAATYSLTFTENRIQLDMLLDLNKEYLKDMGIIRMGDVIAILRHAKQVHESAARDRVLSSATARVPVAAVTGRLTAVAAATAPTVASKVCTPASRILEHYTRNTTPESSPPSGGQKRKSPESVPESVMEIKKSRLIRFGSKQPVAASDVPVSKQTVFARLGNAEATKVVTAAPGKPIFSRLGAKTDTPDAVPNIPVPRDALKYEGIFKAAGAKAMTVTASKHNVRKIAIGAPAKTVCTMRADETPLSAKEKLAVVKTKSVKFSNTVEYKEIARVSKPAPTKVTPKVSPVFNKPERRLTMPDGMKIDTNNGVKARLGDKTVKNLTITKNIFQRLGV